MGGASGKVAKLLHGGADQKLFEEIFKSVDKDKSGALSKAELAQMVTLVFDELAKDEAMQLVKIPCGKIRPDFGYSFLHWAKKDLLPPSQRTRIAREVTDIIMDTADKDKSGTLSIAEFRAFDWAHILQVLDEAVAKKAAADLAAFEASLATAKTFSKRTDYSDGEYVLFITKEYRGDGQGLYWNNDFWNDDKWFESMDDPRLKPVEQKMAWPVKLSRGAGEVVFTPTITDKTGTNSVEFHGDYSSSGNFVCQIVPWPLQWAPKLRFGAKDGCLAVYAAYHAETYFCKKNEKNILNDLVPLVVVGRLYTVSP